MSRRPTLPRTVPPTTPVVVAARRTPVGTAGHALRDLDVAALAAPVLAALVADLRAVARAGVPDVDDVVLGNTRGPGGNPARVAALAAGLGLTVPGTTVDRQCGSGQEAVHVAASAVASGAARLVLAGGAESASTAPLRAYRAGTPGGGPAGSDPVPYERAPFAPPSVDGLGDPDMGPAAEEVARRFGVLRERQDAYALRSHARTLAARARGDFEAELVPVAGLTADERPRAGLTPELLARFPAVFAPGGSVTAGNSCGVSDGAALVAVVPEHVRATLGVPGLAVRSWVAVGVDPRTPGLGPVPAVREALRRSGYALADVDVLEVTEAFAAQVLACADALGLDPLGKDDERVCPQGGAIAQGHPWGASGALLVVRLFSQLVRAEGPRTGVATCAVGGGQGLALVADRVG